VRGRGLDQRAAHFAAALPVRELDRRAIRDVGAGDALDHRHVVVQDRLRGRISLEALHELREDGLRVPREVHVVLALLVEVDLDVARRDALAVEVLVEQEGLDRDVLAARDGPEARARDAVALEVVVARVVSVHGRDDAHVRLVELRRVARAVADAGEVLARDLAVHVDADHDRPLRRLRDAHRVVPCALPLDEAGLLPVLRARRRPHRFARRRRRELHGRAEILRILGRGAGRGRAALRLARAGTTGLRRPSEGLRDRNAEEQAGERRAQDGMHA
jgi:hypothetical protein